HLAAGRLPADRRGGRTRRRRRDRRRARREPGPRSQRPARLLRDPDRTGADPAGAVGAATDPETARALGGARLRTMSTTAHPGRRKPRLRSRTRDLVERRLSLVRLVI